MTTQQLDFLDALSKSLNNSVVAFDPALLQEARDQAVYALMSDDADASCIVAANTRLAWTQEELVKILDGIPYVILKGTAAAMYYPEPIRRTLGDIDVLVSPDDIQHAFQALENAGYDTSDSLYADNRHLHFHQGEVTIELHRSFAVLQTKEQELLLDDWIISAIPLAAQGNYEGFSFPMLPDPLNGLVLLAHINQHLEGGLGFRQILDWLMYVKQRLSDVNWPTFREKTDQLGLTTLAKATARLGQLYLGMNKEITWCRDVRDEVVEDLLEYLFECGNFGSKDPVNNTVTMVLSHGWGVKAFFRNLQARGVRNWTLLKRMPWLKPFAWVYQMERYTVLGIKKSCVRDFGNNVVTSKRRNKLLDELEAKRTALRKN